MRNNSLIRTFYRGIPLVILTMVGGLLIAKKYLTYTTPLYESTAKIKLADTREGVPNSNLFKDFDVFVNSNKISGEVELIKSNVLAAKALSKLNLGISIFRVGKIRKIELYNDSPFYIKAVIANKNWYNKPFHVIISGDSLLLLTTPTGEKVKSGINRIITIQGNSFCVFRNDDLLQKRKDLVVNDHYEFVVHSQDALENTLLHGLDVMAVDKDVPVIRISFKSPTPEKSADVVNAVAAAYIEDYIEEKYRSADTTEQFLNKQLDTFSHKLLSSENNIESYRNQKNIINIRQETETDLRKIADMKKQLASVRMNIQAIDSLNSYMTRGQDHMLELAPNFEAFTDLLSTELVKKIKELQREKKDLLIKYTPENEKVKVVDAKLDDINIYLKESIQNTQKSLHIQYQNLEGTINTAEQVFIGLPGKEKKMTILERNFNLNEDIYRFLHTKRTDAEIAKAATISFHRIISAGKVPTTPVSPNVKIIKIMAAILGGAAGLVIIFLIHSIKSKVNDENTIYRYSDTRLLAAVPLLTKPEQQAVYFRKLALELDLMHILNPGANICISSFNREEGKSFLTNGLSRALQAIGKPVFTTSTQEGILHQVVNTDDWKNYLQNQDKDALILVENFAFSLHPDALIPMACATLNIIILDSRKTRKEKIQEADLLTRELHLPNVVFVLNRAGYAPSLFSQAKNLLTHFIPRRK